MNAGIPPARRVVYLPIQIAGQRSASGNNHAGYIPARSFCVLDYEWQIDYHPKGNHDRQRWVKLRITLVRGPSSPATASFTFRLVYPSRTPDDPLPEVTQRSTFLQGVPTEVPLAPRAALKASGYLGPDGNCFVQCRVTLFHEPDTAAAHPPPSPDLGKHLGNLLSSENLADVTFLVGTESVRAHRCVLAARSPILAADLAGSLVDETHEVEDMDADAFRALLHFIYTDALPPQLEQMDCRSETRKEDQELTSIALARRLLDAADRYGVEPLKIICEEKVCARVDVATVAADLVLAERRGYKRLKATCMEFLVAKPANMLAVARAGGCKLLETSCPSVLTEIVTALAARICLGGGTRT